jgi:spectrin beta
MEDWINSQLTVASSEDYGKDLDDVDRLIHNFDLFLTNLTTHEDKLTHFNTFANELINDVHDQEIEGRTREVRSLWDDLMELAMARKEALVGAKKVHSFDKRIDDTLDWILEKEALLTIDVNCQDEETIQEMKQKQLGIRQDVKAINEQVMAVNKEADVLVATYPDAVDHIVAKRR